MTKKLFKAIGAGALLGATLAAPAAAEGQQTDTHAEPRVLVRVQNFSAVPPGTWREAAKQAESILALAGVKVVWLDCPTQSGVSEAGCADAPGRNEIVLRLMERPREKKVRFDAATGGVAIRVGANTASGYVTLYSDRNEEIAERMGVKRAVVLGHAVAHEMGHLLLATGAHSRWGIMQANLGKAEWERAAKGSLIFSAEEAGELVARFSGRE